MAVERASGRGATRPAEGTPIDGTGSRARRAEALLAHPESRFAIKYGIVGVVNVTADFLLYALLVHLGVWYVAAKTLSLVAATINGYTLNRRWTFRAGGYSHATLVRYVAVQATALAANVVLLAILVELAGLHALVAQLIVIPFIAAFCFLANRFWTFEPDIGLVR